MNHDDNPIFAALADFWESFLVVMAGSWKLFAAWLGSITLMQVQATVGICSALVVTGYTLWKWRKESKERK